MERVCMGILFVILKLIGILLAAVVLLAVAAVSVPVRYQICIEAQDETKGMAVFHWLFHVVDIRLWYRREGFSWRMRILGVLVFGRKEGKPEQKKGKRKRRPGKASKRKQKKEQRKRSIGQQSGKKPGMQNEGAEEEKKHRMQGEGGEGKEPEQESPDPDSGCQGAGMQGSLGVPEEEQGRKLPVVKRMQQRFASVQKRVHEARQKLSGLAERIRELKKHPANIKKMLSEETNKEALRFALGQFWYLCKHYSPAKAWGNVGFSTGDPAQTGLLLGAASILPFWAKYKIDLAPDFVADSFYVKGTLCMKGHMRAFHLLRAGFRLIREKSIRKIIAKGKK